MAAGIGDLNYFTIPFMNEALLGSAVILFLGSLLMNISLRRAYIWRSLTDKETTMHNR
jgi:hypothetical protein